MLHLWQETTQARSGGGHAAVRHPATPSHASPDPEPKIKKPFIAQLTSGFGVFDKLFPKKKEPPKAQPAQLIGTVKMVNLDDKFVLIDAIVYTPGAPGDPLVCISSQRETATLHLSPLRKPPFLIADIVSGLPRWEIEFTSHDG